MNNSAITLKDGTTALERIREILVCEMCLADDRVNIFNQKFNIPEDNELFINLFEVFSRPYGSTSRSFERVQEDGSTAFVNEQTLCCQQQVRVLLFSANMDAWRRKEEVAMAMGSNYAQQVQEKYGMKFGWIPPAENMSELEGTRMLNRFDIDVPVLCTFKKERVIPYYDTFNVEVTANAGEVELKKYFVQSSIPPK